ERIQREHIASNRLGPLCLRVSYGFAKEYETFLRAVLARNTHREVLGMASLGLAHFLDNRRLRIELLRGEPRAAQEFSALYGGDYLAELRGLDRDVVAREAEALLRQPV